MTELYVSGGGANCDFNHISIDKLSPETQKKWIVFIKKTACLLFNPKRVKSAALSLSNMCLVAALVDLPDAAAAAPEG